jgi:hypothetical protein
MFFRHCSTAIDAQITAPMIPLIPSRILRRGARRRAGGGAATYKKKQSSRVPIMDSYQDNIRNVIDNILSNWCLIFALLILIHHYIKHRNDKNPLFRKAIQLKDIYNHEAWALFFVGIWIGAGLQRRV